MRIQITVLKSDTGFHLYAVGGYCGITPAGPRLLRHNHPSIEFHHAEELDANRDAEKLQAHVDEWFSSSKTRKKNYHAKISD